MVEHVRLLVSVRNPVEAAAALDGGADFIDVKEPRRGPMGMADVEVIASVAVCVDVRVPVSASMGELGGDVTRLPLNLDYAKIGLAHAPAGWKTLLLERFKSIDTRGMIAVSYVDGVKVSAPQVGDVLGWAEQNGASGVLLDTAVKDGNTLFDWLEAAKLEDLMAQVHAAGMMIALAGSLHGRSFEQAVAMRPDIVAVRGAACGNGNRQGQIERRCVGQLSKVIESCNAQSAGNAD